jgi:hypothetical protein
VKNPLLIALFAISTSLVAANTGWIGNGTQSATGNPSKATVQWVRQDNSNWTKFKLVENSAGVPNTVIFGFDGSTLAGKNILSILLAAYATKSNIIFFESGTNSNGTRSFDNLSIGNDN